MALTAKTYTGKNTLVARFDYWKTTVEITDTDTGEVYRIRVKFRQKTKPDANAMSEMETVVKARVQKQIDNPPPEPEKNYTESEVSEILYEKKYLAEGEKFSDLPVSEIARVG